MDHSKDALGFAIQDYAQNGFSENIIVESDLCEDDILPVEYLFRPLELMPEMEQKALSLCTGRVLDVGAAAGCHTKILADQGVNVTALDQSPGAIAYLKNEGFNAIQADFFSFTGQYDTLLVLMNGVGITGKLTQLPAFLEQIKKLLAPGGKALCDSTDLTYLYQEDDGSMWVDLNGAYHGEMQFKMRYKNIQSDWFNWLYVDFDLLQEHANRLDLTCTLLHKDEANQYLVSLEHKT